MGEELILPSSTGQLGILTDHAPLLTALDIGVMRLKTGTDWTSIVLMEGFAEIEDNKVTVLCNGAEEANSIDANKAQVDLEKMTFFASSTNKVIFSRSTCALLASIEFASSAPLQSTVTLLSSISANPSIKTIDVQSVPVFNRITPI